MSRALRIYAAVVAFATFVLLLIGGLVNPTGSSLACPDWPLCHGSAFPEMKGGVLFEHSHRLAASTVGVLTVILAVLLWRERRRALGLVAVAMIVAQGVLGGLTVLLKLPPQISIAHLALSMAFFGFVLSVAAADAPRLSVSRATQRLLYVAAGAVYLQIVLGAVVRHTHSALACANDVPLCLGKVWPEGWPQQLHMAHRLWGMGAGLLAIAAAVAASRRGSRMSLAIPILVFAQIALGLFTVTTLKALPVVEAHLGVGALLLASTALLAFTSKGDA